MSRHIPVAAALVLLLIGCSRSLAAPDFTLTDQAGQPWTLSAQRGTPVQIYFGFTHCADTCPTTLARLAKSDAGTTTIVAFVTVDPKRDTPSVLAAYLKKFDYPHMVGLTGTPEQIARVEKRYHIWAKALPAKHGEDDYDVAHIAAIFDVAPNGAMKVETE